jgi:hypothetical protein
VFSQSIESDTYQGVIERGLLDSGRFYSIVSFAGDSENSYVQYAASLEAAGGSYVVSSGFGSEYYSSIIYPCLGFIANYPTTTVLVTNFDDVDLSQDGESKLSLKFTLFDSTKKIEQIRVERNDTIRISNGKIVSSSSTYLYSQMGDTNWNSQSSARTYSYGELQEYSGTKLNPSDFNERT